MAHFWLQLAAALYFLSLLHVLRYLLREDLAWYRPALWATGLGVVFHFVSLVEQGAAMKDLPLHNFEQSISAGAFFLGLGLLVVAVRFDFPILSLALMPLVFLMTLVGTNAGEVGPWQSTELRDRWLTVHIMLVMGGYTAMILMAAFSLFYLQREKTLKEKLSGGFADKLPPLGQLEQLSARSMTWGFVLITLAVATGITWAHMESGTRWLSEGKVHIALFTWLFYLVVVVLRAGAGWRGRRAAFLALYVLLFSGLTWISHFGLRGLLLR